MAHWYTANSKADLKEGLGFFNTFLMAFAYIALFVGKLDILAAIASH